ncbi:MAG: radical SAM protein [Candidatus Nezhaarchaeales archaeon]
MVKEKECKVCGARSKLIASAIGVCAQCLKDRPSEALPIAMEAHRESRGRYGLPKEPPKDPKGALCGLCANDCRIPIGGYGYCGLARNQDGNILRIAGTPDKGLLEWYYDPLPTNCVAAFTCPGCTGSGYPKYAYLNGPEYGYNNLAVFYGSCSLDCLFCQNWSYRELAFRGTPILTAEELASKVNERVSCICYFGGDPSPQMPHAIKTSELAIKRAKQWNGILRICWETNGLMSRKAVEKAVELSLKTGGNIKFDLKAWSEPIYKALCGVSNKPIYENFRFVASLIGERLNPPLLTASTLLVPGYVDVEEVKSIARFIASLNPNIPYSLLAFYPCYMIHDLPTTSSSHAQEALKAAKREGLNNVVIGNIHLLSNAY